MYFHKPLLKAVPDSSATLRTLADQGVTIGDRTNFKTIVA